MVLGDFRIEELAAQRFEAPETARRQRAKLWELRAACSLGLLWRDQGRRNDAGDLLGRIYGWFTEGFGTPDLRDAKALLDALRK